MPLWYSSGWCSSRKVHGTCIHPSGPYFLLDTVVRIVKGQVPERCILRWLRILQCCFVRLHTSGSDLIKLTISAFSGWDIHDATYTKELLISNRANGYRDILAQIDLSTFRRIPWENNVPFVLVSFLDPETKEPICACPRGLLKKTADKVASAGWQCYAGVEYEV